MKELTNSFWAAVFILLACALAVVAMYSPAKDHAAVITMASSIITGAFGYIQGHKDGSNSNQASLPQQPEGPAKQK
jgi:hypothetical protein